MIKSAIITGATGAIGTALIKELVDRNIEVLVFTRKKSNRNVNIIKHNLVTIKFCSLEELKYVKNDSNKRYDVFFHLAWAGTTGNDRNNSEIQNKNIVFSVDAAECAHRFGCKKIVGIGSQAEYGCKKKKLTSKTLCKPENAYGKAKLAAGKQLRKKCKQLNIEFNWVRVLSVYGENDSSNSLISYSISQMLSNNELNVTKCEQIWDYLNSKDAARALYGIAERGINNKTYVLGSGRTMKLKDYLEIIKKVTKSSSIIKYGMKPYSENQVMFLCADISDIANDTGWEPIIDFENGISEIIKSY